LYKIFLDIDHRLTYRELKAKKINLHCDTFLLDLLKASPYYFSFSNYASQSGLQGAMLKETLKFHQLLPFGTSQLPRGLKKLRKKKISFSSFPFIPVSFRSRLWDHYWGRYDFFLFG